MSATTVRASLRVLMAETARNEPNWHYRYDRPLTMPTLNQALGGVVYADCSFGCSILLRLAGGPDPTGDDWQGNSTSMYRHLPHIERGELQVGDIVVFGRDGDQHAVMVYRLAADPIVWSHGQEAGPILVPLSVEIRAHAGQPVTYLRTLPLDPPPATATVDVGRDGRPWLVGQKTSNGALWRRVKAAAAAGKSLTIRRHR